MDRREFIDGLRRALAGNVEPEVIDDTIHYYEDYIDIQLRQGEEEQQVLQRLGKPALLARSMIDANQGAAVGENARTAVYEDAYDRTGQRFSRTRLGDWGVRLIMRMPRWLTVILALGVFLLLAALSLSLLSLLAPALLFFAAVSLAVHLLTKKDR